MTKKEELMAIEGVTEEIADAVIEQYKGWVPHERFNEVNEAKKNAEALIKERDKQLEEVKKSAGDNTELLKQIETLQNENKAAKADYEASIKKMQVDNAVTAALMGAGAKNVKAVTALLTDADKFELAEDGSVKGLKEQIDALIKSDAYLFKSEGTPSGAKPAGDPSGGKPAGKPLSEMTYDDFCKSMEQ